MTRDLYVIEARKPDGSLDLSAPQPETIFGASAIHGMTEDAIARIVFREHPEACLPGDDIKFWASVIDPRFRVRRKYW